MPLPVLIPANFQLLAEDARRRQHEIAAQTAEPLIQYQYVNTLNDVKLSNVATQ